MTITAKELANELELDTTEMLFDTLILMTKDNRVAAKSYFQSLRSDSQKQFLKYIDEFGDMDDYNFFHALI